MKTKEIGWATFCNDTVTEFSESFQEEMSQQLMLTFDRMLNIKNCAEKEKFMLFVGMEEMKTMEKDGFYFGLVEVITRTSMTNIMTAYWRSTKGESVNPADTFESGELEFGWCSDFKGDYFKRFVESGVLKKVDKLMQFRYFSDFTLYPDLFIRYSFSVQPSDEELKELQNLLTANFKNIYVSEVIKAEDEYSTGLDFFKMDFDKGLTQINEFVRALNSSSIAKNIDVLEIG